MNQLNMLFYQEWIDFHLTSKGWTMGSYNVECGHTQTVPTPLDSILTRKYLRSKDSTNDEWVQTYTNVWQKDSAADEIESMLSKFPYPSHFEKFIPVDEIEDDLLTELVFILTENEIELSEPTRRRFLAMQKAAMIK